MSVGATEWSRSASASPPYPRRVRTLRAAAELFAAVESIDTLAPIAAAIGCDGVPSPLDIDTRRALGLDDTVIDARIAAGPGALESAATRGIRGSDASRDATADCGASLVARAARPVDDRADATGDRCRLTRRMDGRTPAAARRRVDRQPAAGRRQRRAKRCARSTRRAAIETSSRTRVGSRSSDARR